MIGFLTGIVKFKEADSLIINVHGVGYQVSVPFFVAKECKLKVKKEFFIFTYVKEDEISLFGFTSLEDKQIFNYLISVSGIGPKSALSIISYSNGAGNIIKAVQKAEVEFFSSIKGIGTKTAQRLIVDLKPKIGSLKELEFETEQDRDLIAALTNLGFILPEIKKFVKGIKKDLPLEEKIKLALRERK